MAMGSIRKPSATAKAPKAPANESRYKVDSGDDRDPLLWPGVYRLEILSTEEKIHPVKKTATYKIMAKILDLDEGNQYHRVGDVGAVLQSVSNTVGPKKVKQFVIAAAGYETQEDYDAFDPDAEFIDATTGRANRYSEQDCTLVGRIVDVEINRGPDTQDGKDFYRNCAWAPVEQEPAQVTFDADAA